VRTLGLRIVFLLLAGATAASAETTAAPASSSFLAITGSSFV